MKKTTGFKISILGESTVGKTSIVNAYSKNQFSYNTVLTTGIVSFMKQKQFDNKEYKFKIFDTAGQERYKSLSNTSIQIADGFLMVFAVDNKNSFNKIVDWINFIEDNVNLEEKVLYLIGNKIDVKTEVRQVTKEEAEEFANSKNAKYFETSALKNEGINEAFEEIFKDIYQMHKQINNRNSNFNLDVKNINNQNNKKKKFC